MYVYIYLNVCIYRYVYNSSVLKASGVLWGVQGLSTHLGLLELLALCLGLGEACTREGFVLRKQLGFKIYEFMVYGLWLLIHGSWFLVTWASLSCWPSALDLASRSEPARSTFFRLSVERILGLGLRVQGSESRGCCYGLRVCGPEFGDLLPNNQRQRRTCYTLCHILYPVIRALKSTWWGFEVEGSRRRVERLGLKV